MIRKSLRLILVTSLLAISIFIVYAIAEKLNHKKLTRENLKSLPTLALLDLDSSSFHLNPDRKKLLVYFNSECGNCQHELDEIIKNRESFGDAEIVFMSSEMLSTIRSFAEKNYSSGLINLKFTKIDSEQAYEAFGNLIVPQIFIYGTDDNLIKQFQGETRIDAILAYL